MPGRIEGADGGTDDVADLAAFYVAEPDALGRAVLRDATHETGIARLLQEALGFGPRE